MATKMDHVVGTIKYPVQKGACRMKVNTSHYTYHGQYKLAGINLTSTVSEQ